MSGSNKIENLFLSVGAMKAGTTWVYDKLKNHPSINFSREKEIYYFSHINGVAPSLDKHKLKRRAQQAINNSARDLIKGRINFDEFRDVTSWYLSYASDVINDEWYYSLFPHENNHESSSYLADFSNLNCFLDREGWEHVRSISNNLKVIYILRDPVSRLWSHYKFHLQFVGHKDMGNPDKRIALFKRIIQKPWFIRNSKYSESLAKLEMNLRKDEFKVFYMEDIVSQPLFFLEEVENFLGISNFDYSLLDVGKRKNASIPKDIPDDWLPQIHEVLSEEISTLEELGYWHEDWNKL